MYAIVEIAGKQFRVEEKKRLRVPLINSESGSKVEFDNVLVYNDDKGLQIGAPKVDKIKVSATVIEHNREKKIVVFKKKRRKGYRVKNGHRQDYSLILVDKIGLGSSLEKPKPAVTVKKEEKAATQAAPKTAPVSEQEIKTKSQGKEAVKVKSTVKATAKSAPTAAKPAAKKTTPVAKSATKQATAKKTTPVAKSATKQATAKKTTAVKKAEPKDKKE